MTLLKKLFRALSSFGFASILLLFLLVLTWLGTLEQVDFGLYETQKKYFESYILIHHAGPWAVRLPWAEAQTAPLMTLPSLPIPLPGVNLLLMLLMVNLTCGGVMRLRKDAARLGILIAHLGVVLLLAAGFVKYRYSNDGALSVEPSEKSHAYYSYHDWDIALRDAAATGRVREYLVPGEQWRDLEDGQARRFTSDVLPFDLLITKVFKNCSVFPKGPMFQGDGAVIDGYVVLAEKPLPDNEQNRPGAYLTVVEKATGKQSDAILWGMQKQPLTVEAGGKPWFIDLGRRRYDLPFDVRLEKIIVEFHPGTRTPRTFWSNVTKVDRGSEQALKITMNEPLRSDGFVLFQSNWGPQDPRYKGPLYSVFTVVQNPSDQWPKWACIIIAAGLLLRFSTKLVKYIRSQRQQASALPAKS